MGDTKSLEQLAARGIVVAPQVEEILQDLRRESAVRLESSLYGHRHAVSAYAANLAFLVLVVVAADSARVLSLPLPHPPIAREIFDRWPQRKDNLHKIKMGKRGEQLGRRK